MFGFVSRHSLSAPSDEIRRGWGPVLVVASAMLIWASAGFAAISSSTPLADSTDLSGSSLSSSAGNDLAQHFGDGDAGAQQIFQADAVSAKSVSAFARNSQPLARTRSTGVVAELKALFESGAAVDSASELRGESLRDTINAFGIDSAAAAVAPSPRRPGFTSFAVTSGDGESPDTFLRFWKDTKSTSSRFDFDDVTLDVSVAGASAENVPIPLPMAVWSALSVLGGMGAYAGIRKWRGH